MLEIVPRPWPNNYEKQDQLRDLIAICRRWKVKEVWLFTSGQQIEPNFLSGTAIKRRVQNIRRVAGILKRHGIATSLNISVVLGHNSMRGNCCRHLKFRPMMNVYGKEAPSGPCLLDPGYRRYYCKFLIALGGTGVKAMLLDDDFRYDYHGINSCYCPAHLDEFARRTGIRIKREAMAGILESPKSSRQLEIKKAWLDFKRQTMAELAREFENALHARCPHVRFGIMLTAYEIGARGGRNVSELIMAVTGKDRQPIVRPGQGFYDDTHRHDLPCSLAETLYQAGQCPEGTEIVPEVDTGNPWAEAVKSGDYLAGYHLKANVACGFKKISLLFSNELEQPLRQETNYLVEAVDRERKVLDCMADSLPGFQAMRGWQVPFGEQWAGPFLPIAGELFQGAHRAVRAMGRLGLPLTFSKTCQGMIMSREIVAGMAERGELDGFFARPIIYDLDVLQELHRRGREDLVGLHLQDVRDGEIWTEQFCHHDFNGPYSGKMAAYRSKGKELVRVRPMGRRFTVLTEFLGPDGKKAAPGRILTEVNGFRRLFLPQGYAAETRAETNLLYPASRYQLRNVLEWLTGSPPLAWAEEIADLWPVVLEGKKETFVSLINLGSSLTRDFHLFVAGEYGIPNRLDPRGQWRRIFSNQVEKVAGGMRLFMSREAGVPVFQIAVFKFPHVQ